MKKILFPSLLFLLLSSAVMASEEVVKDDFEGQAVGQQLDALQNWKFIAGWIKPEYGTIMAEGKNKFLRMKGDIFARNQVPLDDRLTYRFKVRATGADDEVGGLTFRPKDGKTRYDIVLSFRNGGISLVVDSHGTRETLATGTGLKKNVFQEITVVLDKEGDGVKFSVSLDGSPLFEKSDTKDASVFRETFTSGFYTYNNKTLDFDDADFTRGK